MYQSKFIACIMVDDEIVREVRQDGSDCIFLPFGTDYHLRLKNLDHRRAVVSVTIDGEDVLDGSQLVVDGNSTTDLKGFLDSKTNVARNAFRFIEKTERVSKHRGDRVDDGLVRVEVQFEEDLQIESIIKWPRYPWEPGVRRDGWSPCQPDIWFGSGFTNSGSFTAKGQTFDWAGDAEINAMQCSLTGNDAEDEVDLTNIPETTNTVNTDGITVTGNVVSQVFTTTHIRKLAPAKVVIVFKLQGKTSDSKPVSKPLMVKSKIECHTCGEKCKSGTKFCPECGTCLL